MLVLTGREARTFPPEIVRRLFWRVYAHNVWDPTLHTLANVDLPSDASLQSRIAKGEAKAALVYMNTVLFPEDDDGE